MFGIRTIQRNTGLYITANNSYRSKVSSCNSCKISKLQHIFCCITHYRHHTVAYASASIKSRWITVGNACTVRKFWKITNSPMAQLRHVRSRLLCTKKSTTTLPWQPTWWRKCEKWMALVTMETTMTMNGYEQSAVEKHTKSDNKNNTA